MCLRMSIADAHMLAKETMQQATLLARGSTCTSAKLSVHPWGLRMQRARGNPIAQLLGLSPYIHKPLRHASSQIHRNAMHVDAKLPRPATWQPCIAKHLKILRVHVHQIIAKTVLEHVPDTCASIYLAWTICNHRLNILWKKRNAFRRSSEINHAVALLGIETQCAWRPVCSRNFCKHA